MNIKYSRVALWSAAFAVVLAMVIYERSDKLRLPPVCTPIPKNVKFLGPALTVKQIETALAQDTTGLITAIEPGDTVHEFRTEVTGGHLVLRHKCVVGQATAWIR